MSPELIAALKANAQTPNSGKTSSTPLAKWKNGRFVLDEEEEKRGRGGTATSLISEAGGTAGALTGGAIGTAILPGIGTLLGAGVGGLIGGFGGSAAEQKVRNNRVDFGKAGREGALEGLFSAGPIKLAKFGKVLATTGTKQVAKKIAGKSISGNVIQDLMSALESTGSEKLLRGSTIAAKSTVESAVDQANLIKLASKFPELRGSGFRKFQNVEGVISKLNDEVTDTLKTVKNTVPASRITDTAAEVLETMTPSDARAFKNEYNRILKASFAGKNPSALTATDINRFRKIVNSKAARAFQGIEKGRPLSAIDNAVIELRDMSDDLLEQLAPSELLSRVRVLNGQQSAFIRAIPEFKKLSEEGVQVLGTTIPVLSKGATRLFQASTDIAGRAGRASGGRGILPTAGRVVAGSALANAGGQQGTGATPTTQQITDAQSLATELGIPENVEGSLSQEDINEAILMDLQETGGKNIEKIQLIAELYGSPEPTAKQKEAQSSAQALTSSVGLLLQNFEAAGGGQGVAGVGRSIAGRTPGIRSLGLDQGAQVFEDQRKALIAPLARAISGEVGVLTDRDIARAEGLLPRLSDPPQVAERKIQNLMALIQQAGGTARPSLTQEESQVGQ